MRFKKKSPGNDGRGISVWNHKKIGQHLLPLKVPHRKMSLELYLCFFIYSFTSLIHIFEKLGQHYFHSKVRPPQHWTWIDLFKCIFWLLFLLSINLIHIKHRHDISVLNHSIIAPHVFTFHSKASPRDWVWIVFMFLYLFIHSFTYSYFFLLLFICFTLFNLH